MPASLRPDKRPLPLGVTRNQAGYYDYRFRFPLARLPGALKILSLYDPANMLGDPLDANGKPTEADPPAFRGAVIGDEVWISMRHPRHPSDVSPVTTFGTALSADEAATVFGVWAGN